MEYYSLMNSKVTCYIFLLIQAYNGHASAVALLLKVMPDANVKDLKGLKIS